MLILGECRPLASWLALALARACDSNYHWTDVRAHAETPDPLGPLAEGRIPEGQLSLSLPEELERNDEEARLAGAAAATLVRADREHDALLGLEGFLRLPSRTQGLIAALGPGPAIRFVVLGNADRIASMYPESTVGPTLHAILSAGCSIVLTYRGSPPPGRRFFDFELHVSGPAPEDWPHSTVRCEKGVGEGLLTPQAEFPLREFPGLSAELESLPRGASKERG